MGTERSDNMPPRSRQEGCQGSGFQIFRIKREVPQKNLSLNVIAKQRSPESRLEGEIFSHTFPEHSAGSGRDLQGGHKEPARRGGPCSELQPGSFPKGLELAR